MESELRSALADVNPNLTPLYVHTFAEQLDENFSPDELLARLTSLFGLTALLLASIGLYGVTAYSVERRTSEIGIRMALGADRIRVLGNVLRTALMQVLIGLALGIPLAYLAGRLLAGHIYQVPAFDLLTDGRLRRRFGSFGHGCRVLARIPCRCTESYSGATNRIESQKREKMNRRKDAVKERCQRRGVPLFVAVGLVVPCSGSTAFAQSGAATPPPGSAFSSAQPAVKPFAIRMPKSLNPVAPYKPASVPEPDLGNSPRLDQLMRDGKLYLSLRDAIALALENNLDLGDRSLHASHCGYGYP